MHVRKSKTFGSITAAAMIWALSSGGAVAADLGGNCCADLEERIAELESTTARKGNRKVSLTVSGLVHEAIFFFDVDGKGDDKDNVGAATESNVYVGTHNSGRSRFRFKGNADITADWSAGFYIEVGMRANALNSLSQSTSRKGAGLDIRHEALYIKSKTFGTFWIGQTGAAMEGITEVCVGCSVGNASPDQSFTVAGLVAGNGETFTKHGSIAGTFPGEGDRRDIVKWTSLTVAGFSLSAGVGGDDYWDVALRYANEFGSMRVAAGIGYGKHTDGVDGVAGAGNCGLAPKDAEKVPAGDRSCQLLGGSASIMHVPSGLYTRFSYGQNQNDLITNGKDTDSGWEVTAGINTKLNSLGKTNFWGVYNEMEREIELESKLTTWGFGVTQKVDAAAMDLYIWYRNYEAEVKGNKGTEETGDATVVTAGALIRF